MSTEEMTMKNPNYRLEIGGDGPNPTVLDAMAETRVSEINIGQIRGESAGRNA